MPLSNGGIRFQCLVFLNDASWKTGMVSCFHLQSRDWLGQFHSYEENLARAMKEHFLRQKYYNSKMKQRLVHQQALWRFQFADDKFLMEYQKKCLSPSLISCSQGTQAIQQLVFYYHYPRWKSGWTSLGPVLTARRTVSRGPKFSSQHFSELDVQQGKSFCSCESQLIFL